MPYSVKRPRPIFSPRLPIPDPSLQEAMDSVYERINERRPHLPTVDEGEDDPDGELETVMSGIETLEEAKEAAERLDAIAAVLES